MSDVLGVQHATADLVALQRLEQRLEVTFAKTIAVVAFALDEFEEHRAQHGGGENLQQQAGRAVGRGAVQQDAARLQFGHRLAVAGQAGVQHFVIDLVGRGGQLHAGHAQLVHHVQQVVADQRDVLDAFTVELHQEFFDLAAALLGLFVQRDADLAVRRRHGLGRQTGVFALDVEVADLAEVEQLLVEVGPETHAAPVHVVREVVDQVQAVAHGAAVHAYDEFKVDVADGLAVFKPVDQIQRRTTNALDGGQAQFHGAGGDLDWLGAQLQCAVVSLVRILHTEGQATGRRATLGTKVGGLAVGLAVQDEVDAVLAVQHHIRSEEHTSELQSQSNLVCRLLLVN